MEFVAPAMSVTLRDRIVAAYYAFKMSVKPDVQAVLDRLDALQKEREDKAAARQVAIDKLEGYDKAIVTSVAAGTSNAESLLRQVMPAIEKLDDDDQLTIIKHIIKNNPSAVRYQDLAPWLRNHMRQIFDNLPE
jgi:L-lactate utilization protein LutB